jgi:glycosyltransferase involved in cell wall biosynthesis
MDPVSVSVVTPCYNGARYLADTLRSAVGQSRPPLEVIVVDDGSTDDSAAIAESFGPPVRVIRQENRGESAARNRALAEARGTHVLFLDADDLIEPRALAHLAAAVEGRPGAVALMGCGWFTEDPARPHTVKALSYRQFFPDIIESNLGPPNCWLAPLDVVREAGGFAEDMRWFEDWDLWWRVGLGASALVWVPFAGAKYRQHALSQLATTKPADRAGGHAVLMTRMARAFLARPALLEAHGEPLFWSAWTAAVRAREAGVTWSDLSPLTAAIRDVARCGPAGVRASRSARVFRWLGVRAGLTLSAGRQ